MTSAVLTSTPPQPSAKPDGLQSLREFARGSGLQSLVIGISKDPNAKITVLLVSPVSGRPVLAVKVPTTDVAARAVEAEESALLAIRQVAPRKVVEVIPRVVDAVEFDGRRATVVTAMPGIPMATSYIRRRHTATQALVAADFNAVETWLSELQSGTAGGPARMDMDGGVVARLHGGKRPLARRPARGQRAVERAELRADERGYRARDDFRLGPTYSRAAPAPRGGSRASSACCSRSAGCARV